MCVLYILYTSYCISDLAQQIAPPLHTHPFMCTKDCCDAPLSWSRALLFLRVIMGTMFFVLGIYDWLYPESASSTTQGDLRDVALDLYFIALGIILSTSIFFQRMYFVFGFLKSNVGAGVTMLFSAALAVGDWDVRKFQTWCCLCALACGIFFIWSYCMGHCCGWKSLEMGTYEEKQGLLDNEKGPGAEAVAAAGGAPIAKPAAIGNTKKESEDGAEFGASERVQ